MWYVLFLFINLVYDIEIYRKVDRGNLKMSVLDTLQLLIHLATWGISPAMSKRQNHKVELLAVYPT